MYLDGEAMIISHNNTLRRECGELTLRTKIMRAYFNFAYNPVYDFVVGWLNLYRKLQERCVEKLELKDNDKVLCVGLGTGNEALRIFKMNRDVSIVGIDYSQTALRKAQKKARACGKEIKVLLMDARRLEFPAGSFDKVLCIHVVDFIEEGEKVTDEILRVLKDGGQFVITYPSKKEGAKMAFNLLVDNIRRNIDSGSHRILAISKPLAQILVGIVYLPLYLRPNKAFSYYELQGIISRLTTGDFQIEEYPLYNDFIVYGTK